MIHAQSRRDLSEATIGPLRREFAALNYGDVVDISHDGIRVQPSALFPLGIGDGSRCWGVWIERPPANSNQHSFDHLIISPVPPDAWPACFRLRVLLSDEMGALADASRVLAQCEANVLSTDSVPGGFRHAIWNATCVSLPLKGWAQEQLDRLSSSGRSPTVEETRELIMRISIRQFIYINHVKWALRVCGVKYPLLPEGPDVDLTRAMEKLTARSEKSVPELARIAASLQSDIDSRRCRDDSVCDQGYLDSRFFYGRNLLLDWTPDLIRRAARDEAIREDVRLFGDSIPVLCDRSSRVSRTLFEGADLDDRIGLVAEMMRLDFLHSSSTAVDAHLCPTLVGTWCKVARENPIFRFQYEAKDELLRAFPSTASETERFGEHDGLEPPAKATASFSLREPFVRIIPLRPRYRKHRFRAEISYQVTYAPGRPQTMRSSSGILHQVAQTFRKSGFQIIRASNRLTSRPQRLQAGNRNQERGRFVFSLLSPMDRASREAVEAAIDGIKRTHLPADVVEALKIDPKLSRETIDKVFISHRWDSRFWNEERLDRLLTLCRDHGFDPTFAPAGERSITDSVLASLKGSSCFLQIVHTASDEEFESADMTWMIAEYAMARMAGLPIRRALRQKDRSTPRGAGWRDRLKLDAGIAVDEWWDDTLFSQVLPKQLKSLRSEVDRRQG